jgi:hypothetical protein
MASSREGILLLLNSNLRQPPCQLNSNTHPERRSFAWAAHRRLGFFGNQPFSTRSFCSISSRMLQKRKTPAMPRMPDRKSFPVTREKIMQTTRKYRESGRKDSRQSSFIEVSELQSIKWRLFSLPEYAPALKAREVCTSDNSPARS